MKKVRLIRTTIVEYTPDPVFYPEGSTIEQMAEIDIQSDDREMLFEDSISDKIKYEIFEVEEGGQHN